MTQTVLAVFGISAGIVNFIGLLPYVRDIIRHKTKPERATWWVWFLISVMSLAAQTAAGARWSVLLNLSSAISLAIIAVLSVTHGYGTFHRRDTISLIIAGAGIVIGFTLKSPLAAIIVLIAVDISGAWLTIVKSWVAPHTETLSAWVISSIATIFALLAVGTYYPARFIFPLYGGIANLCIVFVIVYRRKFVTQSPEDF